MKEPAKTTKTSRRAKAIKRYSVRQHEWVELKALKQDNAEMVVRVDETAGIALVRKPPVDEQVSHRSGKLSKSEIDDEKWAINQVLFHLERFEESEKDPECNMDTQEAVNILLAKIASYLKLVISLADMGNLSGMIGVSEVASRTVDNLNRIASSKPRSVQVIAHLRERWPVQMSLHPKLCDDYKSLLKAIELGRALHKDFSPGARWVRDEVGKIAEDLLTFMSNFRKAYIHLDPCYANLGKEAALLGEFEDKDAARAWWAVAEKVFLLTYPHPEALPEFAKLVTAASHRKSPGRIRQRFLSLLESRFISYAGKKSF